MAVTIGEFLERLEASGILDEPSLEAVRAKAGAVGGDAERFVRRLHQDGDVTGYQAKALWKNRGRKLSIGNYVVEDELGRGGMGVVLKARHKRMQRLVAVKVLPAKMTEDGDAIARFQREVVAASQLMHTNIVAAYDADEVDGQHILVMEFVDGRDLSAVVKKKGPLSVDQAIDCVTQAARGLEFAHAKGVVHRDIKPANLLLDAEGVIKILDMGLARFSETSEVGTQAELTGTGTIMGTVDYMSPEQALSTRTADERADVYSLGCTLHYLLTATPTYGGDTLMARMMAHANSPLPSICAVRTDVPPGLDDVFRRMIAKDPSERLQSMTEVVAALEGCRTDPSGTIVTATAKGGESTLSGDNLSGFLRSLDTDEVSDQVSPSRAQAATAAVAENVDVDSHTVVSSPTSGTIRTRGERSGTQPIIRNLPVWARDRRVLAGAGGSIVLILAALLWPGSREDVPTAADPSTPGVDSDEVPASDGGGRANQLARNEGWRPIFDGDSLDGWEVFGGEPGDWAIVDGVLTAKRASRLIYTRETFDDVAVRVECRLFERMNSGVALRASKSADQTDGYEAQLAFADSSGIGGGSRTFLTGALWGIAPFDESLVSPGEWFTLEYSAVGDRHIVKVNDRTTVDVIDGSRASGHVAVANFLSSSEGTVEFRRIEIREINGNESTPPAETFALEFDGGDYVDVPFDDVQLGEEYTLEAWVEIHDRNAPYDFTACILNCQNGYNTLLSHHYNVENTANRVESTYQSEGGVQGAGVDLFEGRKHVAVVRRAKRVSVYVDGHELETGGGQIGNGYTYKDVGRLVIGAQYGGKGADKFNFFHGRIDEVRVSTGARYSDEFQPNERLDTDENTLGLYHFDEGQGDVLRDASGNGHDGKIVGAKWVRIGAPKATVPAETFALEFDGDDYVDVPFGDVQLGEEYTLEVWVEIDEPDEGREFTATVLDWRGDFEAMLSHLHFGGADELSVSYQSGQGYQKAGPRRFVGRKHVAVVRRGERLFVYVDGTRRITSGPMGKENAWVIDKPGRLVIAGGVIGPKIVNFFRGRIDEVRVSTVARYTDDFRPQERLDTDENTLALYHFDEGRGDVLKDSSGNGHDGRIAGAKWVRIAAPKGPPPAETFALEFDRSDYVDVPIDDVQLGEEFTLEAWVEIHDRDVEHDYSGTIVEWREDFRVAMAHQDWPSKGIVSVTGWYQSGDGYQATGAARFEGRKHVAVVRRAERIVVYVDGRKQKTSSPPNGDGYVYKEPARMLIGAEREWVGKHVNFFRGRIDEIRVSNVARYDDDFQPKERFDSDENTFALYHFDEGEGDVLRDTSGNGHDGKIVGAKWVRIDGPAEATRRLDAIDPGGPVQVFVMLGGGAMLGYGQVRPNAHATLGEKYPHLLGRDGDWAERTDVRHVHAHFVQGAMKIEEDEWLTVDDRIGPEVGFGHIVGGAIDAPVLLLKSCTGNRALGWDLLPPGSEPFEFKGKIYAGYEDSPASWTKGTKPKPIAWYGGKQYDDDIASAKAVLADFEKHYPGVGGRGYEIAGFVFWQGFRDLSQPAYAHRYERNLARFIDSVRKDFNAPDAPFVLATCLPTGSGRTADERLIVDAQLAVDGRTGKHPRFAGNVQSVDVRPYWGNADATPAGLESAQYADSERNLQVGHALGRAMLELLGDRPGFALAPVDGSAEKGRVADMPRFLRPNDPFTVEMTIHPRTHADAMESRGLWTIAGILELKQYSTSLSWQRNNPQGQPKLEQVVSQDLPIGRRLRIAAVSTGSETRLFVDGKLVGSRKLQNPLPDARVPITLAGWGGASSKYGRFDGTIDEIRISKIARYDADYEPVDRLEPDSNTVALYHCDEATGDTLNDSSGNDHHLTVEDVKWVQTVDARQGLDLLPLVELDRVEGNGPAWKREESGLVIEPATFARTTIDVDVPDEYELRAIVEPLEGKRAPLFALTSGKGRFWLAVNGEIRGAWRSTIEPLPKFGTGTPETPGVVLDQGRVSEIVVTVRRDRVVCVCDGKTLVDWRGDPSQLEEWHLWKLAEPGKFGIGAWESRVRFQKLELRPLTSDD